MFGFPDGLRNAFLRWIHRSGTGLSDLMSPVQQMYNHSTFPVDDGVGQQHLKDRAPFFSPSSPLVVIPQTVHRSRLGMLG